FPRNIFGKNRKQLKNNKIVFKAQVEFLQDSENGNGISQKTWNKEQAKLEIFVRNPQTPNIPTGFDSFELENADEFGYSLSRFRAGLHNPFPVNNPEHQIPNGSADPAMFINPCHNVLILKSP